MKRKVIIGPDEALIVLRVAEQMPYTEPMDDPPDDETPADVEDAA